LALRLRSPAARHVVALVAGVVVLDALAIAVYYAADLATASRAARTAFTAAWTIATLAVVGVQLGRIRKARGR
jgi:hypothetical protein